LLDGLGLDKVHFVGLSLGGMIGQCLALNHGRRLMSLVLCDTAAIVPGEAQPVWEERIGVAREKGLKALVGQTMERWFTPAFLDQPPPGLSPIRNQFLATSVAGFVGCSQAIRKLNYLDRLTEIRIPTLIIVGEDDPGTPVAAAEAMQKRIPSSKLVVLPSARHLSNVEQPQAFNAALTGFLKNV
jgi:3-oxoadipate enol-lactonase